MLQNKFNHNPTTPAHLAGVAKAVSKVDDAFFKLEHSGNPNGLAQRIVQSAAIDKQTAANEKMVSRLPDHSANTAVNNSYFGGGK